MAADRIIKWTTAGAAIGVAAIASYKHPYALVRAHGEAGLAGLPVSLTTDALIYATSIVMPDSARRKVPVPALAKWLLGLGDSPQRLRPTWRTAQATAWQVPQRPASRSRAPGGMPGDQVGCAAGISHRGRRPDALVAGLGVARVRRWCAYRVPADDRGRVRADAIPGT
jgi:hypothetical protein